MTEQKSVKILESAKDGDKVAIVLVRGLVKVNSGIKSTLSSMRLNRKNKCVVLIMGQNLKGMLQNVKDYVTWGPISEETYNQLVEKRGQEFKGRLQDSKKLYGYKTLEIAGKHYKPYFTLSPPRKGFGRKGIKISFKVGGALGNRADKMDDLIMRML